VNPVAANYCRKQLLKEARRDLENSSRGGSGVPENAVHRPMSF
jgi:hypothetical protein